MTKEKRNSKPLLVNFGVTAAISFAGFLYSRLRTLNQVSDGHGEIDSGENDRSEDDSRSFKMSSTSGHEEMSKPRTSDSRSISQNEDFLFLTKPSPKQDMEAPGSNLDTSRTLTTVERDEYELEIEHLRNMVSMLREREMNLEVQLLEYYGLKEQEEAVSELQNRLKINSMEAKLFSLKIESLQSEKERLEGLVADHEKTVAKLESARARIKVLEELLRDQAEKNKEKILDLQKRVARLHEQELGAQTNNPDMESKLQRLKVLECEVEELKQSNTRLQIENSELAQKLESTQILANSVLEDPEKKAISETCNRLRHENEDLTKQIEQLQSDRCADVEELVYLRWINACLQYELRNYQSPTGETVARDLSKSPSPEPEAKAKKLILENADTKGIGHEGMDNMGFDSDLWSSSLASETRELGGDAWIESTFAKKPTGLGKNKFFKNLRRLIARKDRNHPNKASPTSKTDHPKLPRSRSERATTTPPSQSSSGTSSDVPRWRSLDDSNFPLEPEHENESESELGKF